MICNREHSYYIITITLTVFSTDNCCISWSLFPIPINAHGLTKSGESLPSPSGPSFHPRPERYTHGGGQKNLRKIDNFKSNNHYVIPYHVHLFSLPYDFWATLAWRMIIRWWFLSTKYCLIASLTQNNVNQLACIATTLVCMNKWLLRSHHKLSDLGNMQWKTTARGRVFRNY